MLEGIQILEASEEGGQDRAHVGGAFLFTGTMEVHQGEGDEDTH